MFETENSANDQMASPEQIAEMKRREAAKKAIHDQLREIINTLSSDTVDFGYVDQDAVKTLKEAAGKLFGSHYTPYTPPSK